MREKGDTYVFPFVMILMALFLFFVFASRMQGAELTETDKAIMRVKLGEILFFDKELSIDGTVSCASCHNPQQGLSDGLRTAVGVGGQVGPRHTPTIYTAAFHPLQFPDGRTLGVDAQSLLPLTNPIEMGNASVRQTVNRVRPKYNRLSRALYGRDFDESVLAYSISQYEGTQFDVRMPVNQRLEGYEQTFADDPAAERGFGLFVTKGCMNCHQPPLFTDTGFHNTGISFVTRDNDRGRIGILPQGSPRDETSVRAFKTPSLIGIGESAPYTHRGNIGDLDTMVRLYNAGMIVRNNQGQLRRDEFLDPRIRPLRMTDAECADMVHFLKVGFRSNVRTPEPTR